MFTSIWKHFSLIPNYQFHFNLAGPVAISNNIWRLIFHEQHISLNHYICNWCLSPLMLWFRLPLRARCATLCDKVFQWLVTCRWISPATPVSSTNKNWPPRYNWNIVESGVKHHEPNQPSFQPSRKVFFILSKIRRIRFHDYAFIFQFEMKQHISLNHVKSNSYI